jgi:hypothetical protein
VKCHRGSPPRGDRPKGGVAGSRENEKPRARKERGVFRISLENRCGPLAVFYVEQVALNRHDIFWK